MAALSLRGVAKNFGSFAAVHPTDMEISSGEFYAILGPSGCGKTTLLRMIGGYEPPPLLPTTSPGSGRRNAESGWCFRTTPSSPT